MPSPQEDASGVVVVGAGVAGMATTLLLARSGVDVTLVERDPAPPPDAPEDALGAWRRPGIPQRGNGHALHGLGLRVLRDRLPDVAQSLMDAGVTERRFYLAIPQGQRVAADADFVALQLRRPVLDWALDRAVSCQRGARLLRGHSVVDLAADGEGVGGVVLDDGRTLDARWVIDATGHRRSLHRARMRLGLPAPHTLTQPAPTFYYARHFRRRHPESTSEETVAFGLTGDLGHLRFSVLREDSDGFVVTINTGAGQPPFPGLQDPAGWQAAAESLPGLADIVVPYSATPISGVYAYSGRGNVLTQEVASAAGLIAVGDSVCQTNPTQGWGISLALKGATVVADALTHPGAGRAIMTNEIGAALVQLSRPFFEAASAEDRERVAQGQGQHVDVRDPSSALYCRSVVYRLGSADLALYRAAQRRIHLLEDPRRLPQDRDLLNLAAALSDAAGADTAPSSGGPTRPELERLVESATSTSITHPTRGDDR